MYCAKDMDKRKTQKINLYMPQFVHSLKASNMTYLPVKLAMGDWEEINNPCIIHKINMYIHFERKKAKFLINMEKIKFK